MVYFHAVLDTYFITIFDIKKINIVMFGLEQMEYGFKTLWAL
jgi:hypothetical protein